MLPNELKFAVHHDEFGVYEKVDLSKFCFKVLCKEPGCMQIRYVTPQDKTQVKYCKPHTRMHRLRQKALKAKVRRAKK